MKNDVKVVDYKGIKFSIGDYGYKDGSPDDLNELTTDYYVLSNNDPDVLMNAINYGVVTFYVPITLFRACLSELLDKSEFIREVNVDTYGHGRDYHAVYFDFIDSDECDSMMELLLDTQFKNKITRGYRDSFYGDSFYGDLWIDYDDESNSFGIGIGNSGRDVFHYYTDSNKEIIRKHMSEFGINFDRESLTGEMND